MTKRYSIAQARAQLAALVHEVEEGPAVELTRRGKPVAVVLSIEEYHRLKFPSRPVWLAAESVRDEYRLADAGIDPDEVFADVRDPQAPSRRALAAGAGALDDAGAVLRPARGPLAR
jgi:prevent-host-death family protein